MVRLMGILDRILRAGEGKKLKALQGIVPDINGVQRGKVLPAKKFLSSVKDKSLRIPGSVFICTIDGHYPEDIDDIWDKDPDKILIADPSTICVAPGFTSRMAFTRVIGGSSSHRAAEASSVSAIWVDG